jgi:periplasmic protein CpxP/Spy
VKKQFLIPAAIALALGGSVAALQTSGAFAQAQSNPPAASDQAQKPHRDFAARLEHRIDHLKTALKITPAQQPQFDQVAQALRDNATERQQAFQDLRGTRGQPQSAVDRLQTSIKLSELRVTQDQRYLNAFQPLYASFSPDQKQVADQMFAPHHHGHHRI